MKMIELTTTGGRKLMVNLDHIEYICELRNEDSVELRLQSGLTVIAKISYADICDRIGLIRQ